MERCEEGWEEHGDHCYFWSNDTKSWTDAEDFCQKEGGHLASAGSNATQKYVEQRYRKELTLHRHLWLGGNDIEEEAAWKWTDCTPWKVEFWYPGQPDNSGSVFSLIQKFTLWLY